VIRAVVDTNLFVSGMFATTGLSKRLMDGWVTRKFQLVISREILWEIWRVVHYPRIQATFHPKEREIRRFIALIFRKALITEGLYNTDRIEADPTDNKFLACALEGKADYIVSRDCCCPPGRALVGQVKRMEERLRDVRDEFGWRAERVAI